MNWYAVHVVMSVEYREGDQSDFPVWENVYLVEAADGEDARRKGTALGAAASGDSEGSFRWKERPARWVLAGIRKVVRCDSDDRQPDDGTEITYSELTFSSREAVARFASGEVVPIASYE